MIELKNKLCDYIASRINLSDFEDWFIPKYWDVHQKNDMILSQSVYDIELRLAEYSNGHWTENELKEHLLSLLVWYGLVRVPHEEI
jgi:hypothetical protein